MKKIIILIFLILLSAYIIISLHFLDKYYFLCPIEYKSDIIIRQDRRGDGFFAAKRNGGRVHRGVDLYAEIGTQILAARSGIIIVATKENGMGNYIIIKHSGNLMTLYGHLSEINVTKYSFVQQGQIIGRVGKTGNANYPDVQPHLHFEVRKNGIPQDPLEYLE